MSGQFLNADFALPCPPGLRIPEQQPYTITANTLKVTPFALGGGWRRGGRRESLRGCHFGEVLDPPRSCGCPTALPTRRCFA